MISHSRTGFGKLILLAILIAGGAAGAWFLNRDLDQLAGSGEEATELAPATAVDAELPTQVKFEWDKLDDPSKDGWPTEVFNQKAGKVLKELAQLISDQPVSQDALKQIVSSDFRCGRLRPDSLNEVLSQSGLRVERASEPSSSSEQFLAHGGLKAALTQLMEPLQGATDLRCKFKLFRIGRNEGRVVTRQYVAVSGQTPSGAVEQNATWDISWADADSKPKLQAIELVQFEEATYLGDGTPQFVDVTKSALKDNECYESQFLVGLNHWFGRIQDERYFNLLGNPGLAVADVDGDGLDDLYVCQEEGLPNRLFLQQADGTAKECAKEWGVDWLHTCRGCLLVDLDNDGRKDLMVATVGHLIVARNTGTSFELRNVLRTDDDTMSLGAADYDSDGDVDVYVCVYFRNEQLDGDKQSTSALGAVGSSAPGAVSDAGHNTLFRNDIDGDTWAFADVTKETGLDAMNSWYSFACAWEDYDNDGDQDLYVANDYARNNLYRNDGGKFQDVAEELGVGDQAFGMSVSWADYDHNGQMDLYIANMFSSAGGRVTTQLQQESTESVSRLSHFARGNTLLKNNGDGSFVDVSDASAVTVGRWAWGSNFVDVNNDGWEDVVVANGFLTTDDTGDL